MPDLPRNEYFAQLPKLPIAAGALLFDEHQKLLLLKTTYRDGFIIPGGMVEMGESPAAALLREVKEETGLVIRPGKLLCVDYKPRSEAEFDDASLQMIFDGGTLTAEQIFQIKIDPNEHSEFVFVTVEDAVNMCNPKLAKRIPACIRAREENACVYLENGEKCPPLGL